MEEEFINRLLEKFVMNVTALNNYLKCPLEFYFKNLIRIPSPKNEATEFGSAVHYALEQLFQKNAGEMDKRTISRQRRISLPILNGICIVTVKVLPKNNLKEGWNMDRKC